MLSTNSFHDYFWEVLAVNGQDFRVSLMQMKRWVFTTLLISCALYLAHG